MYKQHNIMLLNNEKYFEVYTTKYYSHIPLLNISNSQLLSIKIHVTIPYFVHICMMVIFFKFEALSYFIG